MNAYEIQVPPRIGISPIFNVIDLFPYMADPEKKEEDGTMWTTQDTQDGGKAWKWQMPYIQPPEIKRIFFTRVVKWTRWKEYVQYLVKWNNYPIEDSLLIDAKKIEQTGSSVEKLMDRNHDFFFPESLMLEHPTHHD